MTPRRLAAAACLSSLLFPSLPAFAADAPAGASGTTSNASGAPDGGEKLPAQLPSLTVEGSDLTPGVNGLGKLSPTDPAASSGVRLPDPAQRRATAENNRQLMVAVTPSTLEPPAPLAPANMPYTSLLGGWGPLTQYRIGLYDARFWGPVLGTTELDGRSGWGWSGWGGKEWLDWTGIGRADLEGNAFAWSEPGALQGAQQYFRASLEHGDAESLLAGLDLRTGALTNGQSTTNALGPGTDLLASLANAHVHWKPTTSGDQQWTFDGQAQYRRWGSLSGPEGYLSGSDFWSLSDTVQLEGGLGGGYWGFQPIIDPKIAFHYRPDPATHFYASLQTASELPDFAQLYLDHPATSANTALGAERLDGWAQAGGSFRLSDTWWGSLDAGFSRSEGHIYWNSTGNGLWMPLNATTEQWVPTLSGRLQTQWSPSWTQVFSYAFNGSFPLGELDHQLETRLDANLFDQRLTLGFGLQAQIVTLSSLQLPGGGLGEGLFGVLDARYKFTNDWAVSLTGSQLPLWIHQPGPNYFAPTSLLTLNAQYQF